MVQFFDSHGIQKMFIRDVRVSLDKEFHFILWKSDRDQVPGLWIRSGYILAEIFKCSCSLIGSGIRGHL